MTFPWIIDLLGAAGALLTTVCWLPQMLKVLRINDWPLIGSKANG